MKQAAIFLNGAYPVAHLEFYRAEIEDAGRLGLVVAVDGALNLFERLGAKPNVVLGDFDSVDPRVLSKYPDLLRIEYPVDKDATDGELAVRYVLDQGCDQIEIFGAFDTAFESDQMLANVFLLALVADLERQTGRHLTARLVDHCQEVYFVEDGGLALIGTRGDTLSVIPVGKEVRVTLRGTKWELMDQVTRLGSSWTLRNFFARDEVDITITGPAVIVHRRSGER